MRKFNKYIVSFCLGVTLVFMTACTGHSSSDVVNIDVPERTTAITLQKAEPTSTCRAKRYDMDIKLDTKHKQLYGSVVIQLHNETKDTLNELCIRSDAATLDIKNMMIEGTDTMLNFREKQESSSIYVDISNTPLYADESLSLTFDFTTKIPKKLGRFGYSVNGKDAIYQLTFCYPRIAMYEDGVWDESPYMESGAENNHVTVSDYYVSFEAPKEYTVIASGEESSNGNQTKIAGKNLRQLAIFAGTNMKVDTDTIQGVTINNYYFDHEGNAKYYDMSMDAAKDSINLFTTLIGKYPYQELDIVHGYYSSAMEYSGVILMGLPDVDPKHMTKLDKHASFTSISSSTAHEIAHQWFYGVVGNDPYDEPWLDESLAEYCEDMLYQQSKLPSVKAAVEYEKKLGIDVFWGTMSDKEFNKWMDICIEQTSSRYIINKSYDKYNVEENEYSLQVYDGGSYFLYELRKAMGDGVFFPMLQEYYKAYYFNESTTEDFVEVVRTFDSSEKVEQILNKYIQ